MATVTAVIAAFLAVAVTAAMARGRVVVAGRGDVVLDVANFEIDAAAMTAGPAITQAGGAAIAGANILGADPGIAGERAVLRHDEDAAGLVLFSVEVSQDQDMAKLPGNFWCVYMLRCADGSLYTGITTDLSRRCRQHNAGTASRYTRCRRPTLLVYSEQTGSRS